MALGGGGDASIATDTGDGVPPRTARSSAITASLTLAGRSSGTFASIERTTSSIAGGTDTSGAMSRMGGTGALRWAAK